MAFSLEFSFRICSQSKAAAVSRVSSSFYLQLRLVPADSNKIINYFYGNSSNKRSAYFFFVLVYFNHIGRFDAFTASNRNL